MTDEPVKSKRQYQLSSKVRAERAAKRAAIALDAKKKVEEKKIASSKAKLDRLTKKKKSLGVTKKVAKILEGKSKNNVVTTDEIAIASPVIREIAAKDEDIAFLPTPGPQTEFLSAPETEVLYGGAAGGGKSYAMLVDPLRDMSNPAHRALLIRKTLKELTELIEISKILYPKAFPGAKYSKGSNTWNFPSGGRLYMGYCDTDQDVDQYVGQSYSWIGIDELTHFRTPYVWETLRSRLRTTAADITPYMRATTNPGGIGGWWVKKMFVDPAPWGKSFWATDIETGETLLFPDSEYVPENLRGKPLFKRRFIPAKLSDNPYLMRSPEYLANLASLSEVQRRRLLEGDWNVAEDTAFPEFDHNTHVVESFIPPGWWRRVRACDYGYVAGTAVLWLATDPDGVVYVYRELYTKGLDAKELGNKIIELEDKERPNIPGVLDHDSFALRGQVGPTNAEIMNNMGVIWRKADKGPGSRMNGKNAIHQLLKKDRLLDKPKLVIMDCCKELIKTLPILPLEKNRSTGYFGEDVDTNYPDDHLYDALRYGVTSREVAPSEHPEMRQWRKARQQIHIPADQVFGY